MSWRGRRFPFLRQDSYNLPLHTFNINENCFIRKNHKCGKIYNASKSCFIACPSDDELEPILSLISEKVSKMGVEAQIAIKERAYGQDIFCTKICGKIIESRFCVVILDDSIKDSKCFPNPNVYYEYGLMTSLRKHIIPLQKQGQSLAFNIQSYDTIKYTNSNISIELDRAIKDAMKISDSSSKEIEQKRYYTDEKSILRNFELSGFILKDENWFLNYVIEDTDFKGLSHEEKSLYVYLGKIDEENEFRNYLSDIDVVSLRTEKEYKNQEQKLNDLKIDLGKRMKTPRRLVYDETRIAELGKKIEDIQEKMKLMGKIYYGFIINPNLNNSEFAKKAEESLSGYNRFKLICSKEKEIEFEEIKVNLSSS